MSLSDKFGIAILILSAGAQFFYFSFLSKYVRQIFLLTVLVLFFSAAYSSVIQYYAWKMDRVSVFLLPPYRDLSYFLEYVSLRIFSPIVVAFLASFVFKAAVELANKKLGERFFEKGEGWFLALGIFLSGYPGFLFYIPLLLLSASVLSIFYILLKKGRAPLLYLWLPAAIFAILLKNQLPPSFLNIFII